MSVGLTRMHGGTEAAETKRGVLHAFSARDEPPRAPPRLRKHLFPSVIFAAARETGFPSMESFRLGRGSAPERFRSWWSGLRRLAAAFMGCGVLAGAAGPASATEFGGMVFGRDEVIVPVLRSLQGSDTFRWIRSASPRVPEYGFQGVGDVQHVVPRGDRARDALPRDLFEVYHTCRTNLPSFEDAPRVWEVWNEPDFHFIRDSAADMAAVLKAAWWGVKSARPGHKVLMPSLAFRPARYAVELAHNGMGSWTDGYNLHFYGWAADFPRVLAHHRVLTDAVGLSVPWWVTEIGYFQLPASGGDDAEALARQAAFHERVMVESWCAGVGVHLAFILNPYVEGGWDLGLTDSVLRWRPALAAVQGLGDRLQGAEPWKRLVDRATGASLGVALKEQGEDEADAWWMILWSPARLREQPLPGTEFDDAYPLRYPVQLRWRDPGSQVRVGMAGETPWAAAQLEQLELTPERNLHLRAAGSLPDVEGGRWMDVAAPVETPRVRAPWRRELDALPRVTNGPRSPVVVRIVADGGGNRVEKPGQRVRVSSRWGGPLTVQLHNFGKEASGRWSLEVAEPWRLQDVGRGTPPGRTLDGDARVASLQRQDLSFTLIPPAEDRRVIREPARLWARWRGADGSEDVASIRIAAEPGMPAERHRIGWRGLRPRPVDPATWRVFESQPGVLHVESMEPAGPLRDAAIRWEVPRAAKAGGAWLEGALRTVQARGRVHAQLFAVTDEGEVWRYGEWRELSGETPLLLRASWEDYEPTVWSRHHDFGGVDATRVRWMVLRLQGLSAGDVVEIQDLGWCR